jgi:hypothetical protein
MRLKPHDVNGRYGMRSQRKFNNVPTRVGDRLFASRKEAGRFDQLKLLEKNGEVRDILCQVPFKLEINGRHICRYIADFTYVEKRNGIWAEVVEDVKGYKTAMYRLKKKLMKAIHGIEVRET